MMFGSKNKGWRDADYDEVQRDDADSGFTLPAPARFALNDYLAGLVLGLVGIVFICLLTFSALHPTAWISCAEASGLRAPTAIIPGLWRLFAHGLYSLAGVGAGNALLAYSGKFSFGVIIGLSYLFCRGVLSLSIRSQTAEFSFWRQYVSRLICALAAFLFAASDPVWQLCLSFSPQTFLLVLMMFAACEWVKFLTNGSVRPAYISMVCFGFLSAESPFGLIITMLCWVGFAILRSKHFLSHVELMDDYKLQSSKWYLTFFWAFGLVAGIALNVLGFALLGGLDAAALGAGDVPLRYGVEYFGVLTSSASLGGWIICGGLSIMVLVIVLMSVVRTTDMEHYLGYTEGLTFFVVGCLAYMQLFSIRALWVWTWIKSSEMVRNPLLLALFVFFFAMAFLVALAVLSVNLFCRDPQGLSGQIEEEMYGTNANPPDRNLNLRKAVFLVVCVLFAAGALPGRIQHRTNRMLALMRVYTLENVREAGDARWLFPDGSFDAGIELESAARGKSLVCLPVFNGLTARRPSMLASSLDDAEDRLSAQVGGANILSSWQRDKPARLSASAVQLGFELWRRSGDTYPATSGVLARPNMDPKLQASGIRVSHGLMDNIIAFYQGGEMSAYAGRYVHDLFLFMQWRLSRLARIRAEIADHAGNKTVALEENDYANKLDDKNESLKRLIENISNANRLMMRQMTPREGLQFALVRADFRLARHYAEPILKADPDNPSANFGMGMSYFEEEQYSRAEEYLARCLKRNPNEPAVWNNLAVVKMKAGRLDEARKDAEKALSLIPESIEVKDTIREIDNAIKQRAEKAKKASDATIAK